MIYVHEEKIADRASWGDVHVGQFILPSDIRRIRGVLINILPDEYSILRRLFIDISDIQVEGNKVAAASPYEIGNVTSVQIGSVSLSINDETILTAAMPANVTKEMHKSSWKRNLRVLDGVPVTPGSMLRFTIEEKNKSPFINAKELEIPDFPGDELGDQKLGYQEAIMSAYGEDFCNMVWSNEGKPTNGYTLKIYIDYV